MSVQLNRKAAASKAINLESKVDKLADAVATMAAILTGSKQSAKAVSEDDESEYMDETEYMDDVLDGVDPEVVETTEQRQAAAKRKRSADNQRLHAEVEKRKERKAAEGNDIERVIVVQAKGPQPPNFSGAVKRQPGMKAADIRIHHTPATDEHYDFCDIPVLKDGQPVVETIVDDETGETIKRRKTEKKRRYLTAVTVAAVDPLLRSAIQTDKQSAATAEVAGVAPIVLCMRHADGTFSEPVATLTLRNSKGQSFQLAGPVTLPLTVGDQTGTGTVEFTSHSIYLTATRYVRNEIKRQGKGK